MNLDACARLGERLGAGEVEGGPGLRLLAERVERLGRVDLGRLGEGKVGQQAIDL